jgi:hypothetical protein
MALFAEIADALRGIDRFTPRRRLIAIGGAIALAAAFGREEQELAAKKKRRQKKKRKSGKGAPRGQECSNGCISLVCGQTPADCPILPPNNIWNRRIDRAPLVANSAAYVTSIGAGVGLHADFGSRFYEEKPFGIPFVRVPAGQPAVGVSFTAAPDESDPGPYPIPADAPVENGSCSEGDRHVIVVQEGTCMLYEMYDAWQQSDGSWRAYSGAKFDLRSNTVRPGGWTSADAAGLPILPGLVRYEEIAAGSINHALRFTASQTRTAYVWPARHQAGSTDDLNAPPMGQRFRLKASVDISGFSNTNQIILQALKTYGMILADNGSNWFLSGAPDDQWDNDDLRELRNGIRGSDFEAVDISSLMVSPQSGEASV